MAEVLSSAGLLFGALIACVAAGCGTAPRELPQASAGEPAVFTTLHVVAARTASASTDGSIQSGSVRMDMLRFFRSKPEEFERSRIRADVNLETVQAASSVAQLIATNRDFALTLKLIDAGLLPTTQSSTNSASEVEKRGQPARNSPTLAANNPSVAPGAKTAPAGNPAPSSDGERGTGEQSSGDASQSDSDEPRDGTKPPTPTTSPLAMSDADKQKLATALSALVTDSPFDQIDRAYNFYNALHLKTLMIFGRDSRVLDTARLKEAALTDMFPLVAADPPQQQPPVIRLAELALMKEKLQTDMKWLEDDIEQLNTERAQRQAATTAPQSMAHGSGGAATETQPKPDPAYLVKRAEVRYQEAQAKLLETRARLDDVTKQHAALAAGENPQPPPPPKAPSAMLAQAPASPDVDRLLYLVFPVSVTPGTRANYMTGVRIRIVDASIDGVLPKRWEAATNDLHDMAGLVRVISLHPTRSYDVESQIFIDLARDAVRTSIDLAAPIPSANTNVAAKLEDARQRDLELRRNFLSRLNKQSAYVDAPNHEFGWNFFPTNLQVTEVGLGESMRDFVLSIFGGRSGRAVKVRAFLDGSGYDCAAYVVVPQQLTSFTYQVEYVTAYLDDDGRGGEERRFFRADNSTIVEVGEHPGTPPRTTVPIPPFDAAESAAMFIEHGQGQKDRGKPMVAAGSGADLNKK